MKHLPVIATIIFMTVGIVGCLTGVILPEKLSWQQIVGVIVLTPIVAFFLYAGARRSKLYRDDNE